jgi:hypothetical protein
VTEIQDRKATSTSAGSFGAQGANLDASAPQEIFTDAAASHAGSTNVGTKQHRDEGVIKPPRMDEDRQKHDNYNVKSVLKSKTQSSKVCTAYIFYDRHAYPGCFASWTKMLGVHAVIENAVDKMRFASTNKTQPLLGPSKCLCGGDPCKRQRTYLPEMGLA